MDFSWRNNLNWPKGEIVLSMKNVTVWDEKRKQVKLWDRCYKGRIASTSKNCRWSSLKFLPLKIL